MKKSWEVKITNHSALPGEHHFRTVVRVDDVVTESADVRTLAEATEKAARFFAVEIRRQLSEI